MKKIFIKIKITEPLEVREIQFPINNLNSLPDFISTIITVGIGAVVLSIIAQQFNSGEIMQERKPVYSLAS